MIFSVNNCIVYYNSGVEHAEIKRDQLFQHYHVAHRILTDNWSSANHYYLWRIGLSPYRVINMYDFFQLACHVKFQPLHPEDLPVAKQNHVINGNGYRMVRDGKYSFYIYTFDFKGYRNQVRQVNCFYCGSCYQVDYFDIRGFLSRRMTFKKNVKYETGELFFSPAGKVSMCKRLFRLGSQYYSKYYIWGASTPVTSRDHLILHFLNLLCWQFGSLHNPVLFIADRWWRNNRISDLLGQIKYPHYMAFYAHYSHTNDDKRALTASTERHFLHIFRQAHSLPPNRSYDALICSTQRQVDDIRRRYHLPRALFTIPVGVQVKPKLRLLMVQRNAYQINCVTRISSVEGVLDTVRAFGMAKQRLPNLNLNIYGQMGSLSQKFRRQLARIKAKYDISDQDFTIRDYTYNVPKIYRSGQLTLITAPDDSFNISLLEALSQGCPAIVYNNNYGPRDMVINGYDGYQVDNDCRVMARKIVWFFQHPDIMQQMSNHAYQEANQYSPDRVWRHWRRLLRKVKHQWPDKLI